MANKSKIIVSTERNEEFEEARTQLLRAKYSERDQAINNEIVEITGKEINGLASSRFAVGAQKHYKVTPGGPKNLDPDDNALCRYTPSPQSKMSVSPNGMDLETRLSKLGGLNSSRFSPNVDGVSSTRFHSQSSSAESALKPTAIVFTPTKANSRASSLSGSAKSFTPKALETSPSSNGGVSLASPPLVTVKDIVVKKQTPEKLFEEMLLADHRKRMSKFQTVTPTKVTDEAVIVSVSSPPALVKGDITIKQTPEKSMEQRLYADLQKQSQEFPQGIHTEVSTTGDGNVSVVSQDHSAVPDTSSIIDVKSIDVPVAAKNSGTSSITPVSNAAPSARAPSMSGSMPNSPSQISRVAIVSGPSLMKENEFMAMLIKAKEEKDLKLNIQQVESDFPHPPTRNSTNNKVGSRTNNTVEHNSDLPTIEKSTSSTRIIDPTTMSNPPLVPAPINAWTTARLTQGKGLSKADEDFQNYIAKKVPAATEARAQKQAIAQPLSPKPTAGKRTQAEINADKSKLAAGEAAWAAHLNHRFANTPTSPPTRLPTNKTNNQDVTPKSDAEVFSMPESTKRDGQAILSELKVASKNLGVANASIIKTNVPNIMPLDEKIISTMRSGNNSHANTASNLVTFKRESSQDKISHVAVHGFEPNEKENATQTNTQVNNPFNGKPMNGKNLAGSIISSPPFWSTSSFSDIGEATNVKVDPNFKEGVRVTETQDANTILLDWDGSWCAPPIWEDRGAFDSTYVPSYISEWSAMVSPVQPVTTTIDTSAEGFISGEYLVNNTIFSEAPKHDETIPDTSDLSLEQKRLNQTAGQEAAAFLKKFEKKRKAQEYAVAAHNAHYEELMAIEPEPNPAIPKIEIYLRPATEADAKEILKIYNHYIIESYIPEDQEPLTESDIEFLIQVTKKEKLPFVVAVKGRVPAQSTNPKIKTKIPQYENIISFGYTEIRGCGIAGKCNGRGRYTHNLHLYVDPAYTRKGVGSCVLDRLLIVSSRAWCGQDGHDWLNFNNDPVYGHGTGARCHQLLIEVPVLRNEDDPNYEWIKSFLRKFWFFTETRIKAVGRSSVLEHAGKWLDIVYFQKETELEAEFTPFT